MNMWKSVVGYESKYEVNEIGQVKSLSRLKYCGHPGAVQTTKERLMKIHVDRIGYKRVKLSKDGTNKLVPLHRVVAMAFVENPENKKEVNHIDGDKNNNQPENLEWVTRSENMKHAFKNNLISVRSGEKNNKTKLTNEKVRMIRSMRDKGFTMAHIAELFKVSAANISEIVNRNTWKDVN